ETIADLYANGNQIRLSNELTGKYCVDYSDDSSTCPSDFERDCIDSQSGLNKRVFSTTRLVTCPSSNEACVLMVKTCE
ncbi:hypothetical protein HUU53_03290, partial [Candidatus Micrarchaeota archaeon]|nr:hypothetical protein [Candidatus Micrarchaeota archaeon]